MVAIDAGAAVPNPNPDCLALRLQGDVDSLTVRCYTKSMALAWQERSGPWVQGWNRVPLPQADMARLPNGLYYLSASARRANAQGRKVLLKIVLAR